MEMFLYGTVKFSNKYMAEEGGVGLDERVEDYYDSEDAMLRLITSRTRRGMVDTFR